MYEIILLKSASDFYDRADKVLKRKLDRCFEILSHNPFNHNNIKRLKGEFTGYYRFRLGDYRVIYRIDSQGRLVIVSIIAHRSKAYN